MTTYLVLRRDEDGTYRVLTPDVDAHSDLLAVRKVVARLPPAERSGEFVATPQRSFRVRKLMVETVQKELWT